MDKMGREAIISVGSNVPDKRERVEKACEELKIVFILFKYLRYIQLRRWGVVRGSPTIAMP